jgi:hypothetical protein
MQSLTFGTRSRCEAISSRTTPLRSSPRTEIYLRLEPRLPAVLRGEEKPKDAAETMLYARMCKGLHRYAASVRFAEEAFAEDPSLIKKPDGGGIYAAASAVLGGCGPGKDDPPLDEEVWARLRGRTLKWLREDLAESKTLLEKGLDLDPGSQGRSLSKADALSRLRRSLENRKTSRDLRGVRDPERLAKLPEAERREWQAVWAEVDALIVKAGGGKPK